MKQDFCLDVLVIYLRKAPEDEVGLSLAQEAILFRHSSRGCHIYGDARVLPTEPSEHGRDGPGYNVVVAGDTNLADRWIGQELDVLHPVAQFIEHRGSTPKQGPAVLCRLDPLAIAIKQAHTERML